MSNEAVDMPHAGDSGRPAPRMMDAAVAEGAAVEEGAPAPGGAAAGGEVPQGAASETAAGPATPAAEPELTEEERAAIHERNAFIHAADAALTDVRQRSYEGKLTTTVRWAKRSFAPEGTDAKAFEERLISYIEDRDHAEAKPVMGRITAPKPLDVVYEGQTFGPDEPLPDLEVADIALMYGKKGVYLYSVALLSHSFARALFLSAEDNDVATFVDVVRSESSIYPRPVGINAFKNPPYLWSPSRTRSVFDQVKASGSFADIAETKASNGVSYYYSTMYLSAAQAASLAEWDAVERRRNP